MKSRQSDDPIEQCVTEMLAGLQPRERLLLLAAVGATVLAAIWLGVVEPLAGAITDLDRKVAAARSDASQVADLVARHKALSAQVDALEKGAAAGKAGPSLFARLESITVPIVGRERITAMNPSSRPVGERFEEETVDMRLEGVSMPDLIQLLYKIEHGDTPMHLVRASFKRQYRDAAKLDATLVVARLTPR